MASITSGQACVPKAGPMASLEDGAMAGLMQRSKPTNWTRNVPGHLLLPLATAGTLPPNLCLFCCLAM